MIYIDNYDEVMNSVEEVRQSLLVALVDRKRSTSILKSRRNRKKKTETDKYFIALKKQEFKDWRMTNSLFLRM